MTAETNKHIMERFTSEFLTTGDASLAEELLSPDVVLHFAGQQLRGRDRYLAVVAANGDTFEDLVWTVEDMVADGDTVAVRYTMTGTHRGEFAGVPPTGTAVLAQSIALPSTASPTARSSRSAPSSTCSESSSSSVPHQPRNSAPPPFAHQSPTPVRRWPRTETRGPHDHRHIRGDSTDPGAGRLGAEYR